ncbi:MAG: hypothetical protein HY360_06350 [Verrucomicrobia bacterium]|nr:hypothetical protein [Verrucomicrobiota bacterium]
MQATAPVQATTPTYPPEPAYLAGSRIVAEYRRKTPTSEKLADRARRIFPSGITHDVRYIEPYGIYVTRAQASHKWDVDGNEYVDYPGGHGAPISAVHTSADCERTAEAFRKTIQMLKEENEIET